MSICLKGVIQDVESVNGQVLSNVFIERKTLNLKNLNENIEMHSSFENGSSLLFCSIEFVVLPQSFHNC